MMSAGRGKTIALESMALAAGVIVVCVMVHVGQSQDHTVYEVSFSWLLRGLSLSAHP